MTQPHGPQLRIGHAERDRAVEVLRDAAGEGRLTLEELEQRIEVALAARTQGDLREVLADLIPAGTLGVVLAGGSVTAQEAYAVGQTWDDPLVITAKWDDENRVGVWDIPPFIECAPVAGNVKLYCLEARPLASLIDIVVAGGAGDIIIVLPPGWAANVDRVTKGMGSVKSSVPTQPTPGSPLLIVRGAVGMGTLKVRGANGYDLWVINRDRRKRGLPPITSEGRPQLGR